MNPTPPSASADNEQEDELKRKLTNIFNNAFSDGEDGVELREDDLAQRYVDVVMSLIAHHTKEAVDRAVLEKAIELRNIAEAHLHESSAAWAIAQEIGAEVSRLKAELAAPAVHKTDIEGGGEK